MAVFDKASLVMIPSQYKEGKIYNIKPEDQSSSFEFERGSAATRVNSSGLIETLYDEATNLLLQSNQFDTTWSTTDSSVTSGQSGYDGSLDAWLLNSTTTGSPRVEQSVVLTGVNTFSVYVKSGTDNFIQIRTFGAASEVWFNLATGGIVSSSGAGYITSKVENIGSGWYRCSVTVNGSLSNVRVYTASAFGVYSTSGNGVYIQDAQLESGYFATPYIETTTEAVTRPNRHDTPRLDYSGTEPALLLEPQRTNLIANANSYSGNLVYYTVTSGQNSPDGESNATLFVEKTNTASHIINSNGASISGGQTYTYSFFIKYAGKQNIPVNASDGLSGFAANIDILNGVVNSGIAEIQEFEDGWYRVSMTRTAGAGATNATIQMNFGNITGDGTSGFYLFGYQIEQGSYATSYIPTNGQAETRLADVCQGGGDASVFNDSEGVLYAEVSRLNGDLSATTIAINKGGSEFSGFSFRTDGKIWAATYNGTSYENISQYTPTDFYDTYKICYKYKSNDFALWVNGVEVDSSVVNTLTLTGLNNLSFSSGTATNKFLGNVRALHYFPEALTDTELQQLTTI